MILKLVTAPVVEPVELAMAKLHCRVDISTDNDVFLGLIISARQMVEQRAGRALITQTWRLSLNGWPANGMIELPHAPLQSVTSIQYTDGAGATSTVSAATYTVDTDSEPGRVALKYNQTWPTVATLATVNPIQVAYVAGYGATAASVPEMYRQAILLLVGHWYENREAVIGGTSGYSLRDVPLAFNSLVGIDRMF